ncbi:MAG: hypothetical protein NXI04_23465 [Planctomycetaceae bacterium]|nr:hypothetical protein [Planctomycetaceae bacterium]
MSRTTLLPAVLLTVFVSVTLPSSLPGATRQEEKAATKSPYRRLPAHFGKLNLKPDQVEEIYEIREQYGEKLAKLRQQLERLREEQQEQLDDVLTKTQLSALKKFRDGRKPVTSAKTATSKSRSAKKGKSSAKKSSENSSKDGASSSR